MANEQYTPKTGDKNPHWSQWIPLYGMYRIIKDEKNRKPSIAPEAFKHPQRFVGIVIYHGICGTAAIFGAMEGLEAVISFLSQSV